MVEYFNFYYNTLDNKDLSDYGIFLPNGDENEYNNFKMFINFLKNECHDFAWADYGLSEKIVFAIPDKLKGKKFFNTKLKDYVVFSPDNQGCYGNFSLTNVVYTANYCKAVENAYNHIDELLDDDEY